jgi:DNA primase
MMAADGKTLDVSYLEKVFYPVFYPQTGFTKGLQNFVPLNSRVTYEKTKAFAHDVAETLEREFPETVV